MNWFKNLKIRTKLLLSFAIITFVAAIIGYLGVTDLHYAAAQSDETYYNILVPISDLGEINGYFQRVRVETRDLLLSKNDSEIEENVQMLYNHRATIDKLAQKFEKTILSEDVRKLFDNFKNSREKYGLYLDKLIVLAKEHKDAEGFALLNGEMKIAANNEMKAIASLDEIKQNHAAKRNEEMQAEASSTQTTLIIILAIGFVLAAFIGLYIANYLSKNIKQVVECMESLSNIDITNVAKGSEQLANGDLNINIVTETKHLEIDSKDEIGHLANNMNKVITNTKRTVDSVEKAVRAITETVNEINVIVDAAINGKLKTRGNASKFSGSFRELVEGLNNTLEAVTEPINEQSEVLGKMSSGDLTVRMKKEYKGDFLSIKNSINNLSESFSKALSEVVSAVSSTASASAQISSSAEEMAAGAQEQSTQTTEIAGAVEQMTKTIVESSRNATLAAEQSKLAKEVAYNGGKSIQETINGMNKIAAVVTEASATIKELGQNSEKIGTIIDVIDDIADQTNLLALNAAIEAARAGEHGRGFAVVADEVRKLAERTTKATKEISDMIKEIQRDTNGAVVAMEGGTAEVEKGRMLANESGKSLNEIINKTTEVMDIINQVAAASEEQSSAAEQISHNIEGINNVTQQAATGVQEIARAAEDLNNLTITLQNLINQFKIDNNLSSLAVRGDGKLLKH